MATARIARVLARVLAADAGPPTPVRLCQVAAELGGASGAGVMLLAHGAPQASMATTGPVSDRIEELQYALGQGPCIDAQRTGTVIAEPDLAADHHLAGRPSPRRLSTPVSGRSSASRCGSVVLASAPSTSIGISPDR